MKKSIKIFIIVILILLAFSIITGCVIALISPKVAVSDISVIRADNFFTVGKGVNEHDAISLIQNTLQIARTGSDVTCQLLSDVKDLPSQSLSDYSVVIINMTVIGRSPWDGQIPYVLIDEFEDPDGILLVTMPEVSEYDIDRFNKEENCEIRFFIHSGGKSEEEIAAVLKSIRIKIPYHNWIHPDGIVYASCKDCEIK